MGGINYFSNGIYFNIIEVVMDVVYELWENINVIDDVVFSILMCSKCVMVVVMLGNVGVGGVMVVIVVDVVWVYCNVVFYLSYKFMEFFGFEYWIYSLLKWVGVVKVIWFVISVELVLVVEVK